MKVLVANRGEIACRILRTLRELGMPSVAVYTEPDRNAPHVSMASEAVALGGPDQYLAIPALIAAAKRTGASAIHPGYGFLSQNAALVRACEEAKLTFIGPTADSMAALGDKRASRDRAEQLGIPVIPGARDIDGLPSAQEAAARLGYPVLLKAAGGGGGKGMRRIDSAKELADALESARREAGSAFADDHLLMEKFISPARHVEVQILGDGRDAVAVGERECSLQRRYQKIIEEAPADRVPAGTREKMADAAVRLARSAGYRSAGTVEFIVQEDGSWFFLEVNARLQVEHPVTEMVTGLDLVRAQIELAAGGFLPGAVPPRAHAIEARLNAEDPYRGFLPQAGRALMVEWPRMPGVRIDAGLLEGQEVGTHYDPLLAKVIAAGSDREQARRKLIDALRATVILGIVTNQSFLLQVLESDDFCRGKTYTTTLETSIWTEPAAPPEVREAFRRLRQRPREGIGARPAETHSPWHSLGRFRIGT